MFTRTQGKPVQRTYSRAERRDDVQQLHLLLQDVRLTSSASQKCGVMGLAGLDVTVRQGEDGVYLTGLVRCGCVQTCAACREDFWVSLRREFSVLHDIHVADGGLVRLLTLTCGHRLEERLVWILRDLLAAWIIFTNSRAVRALKKRGMFFKRVLEVVHRHEHGWHPHFHVPVFLPSMTADEETAVVATLRGAWCEAMKRASNERRVANPRHQDWATDVHPGYAAKGDVRHRVKAEPRAAAAFELARAATQGDAYALELFREYLDAIKELRPRVATPWTKGFPTDRVLEEMTARAAYAESTNANQAVGPIGVEESPTYPVPEAQARAVEERPAVQSRQRPPVGAAIATIPCGFWALLFPVRGMKRAVLKAANTDGLDGVVQLITPILWHRETGESETSVPPELFEVVREAVRPH